MTAADTTAAPDRPEIQPRNIHFEFDPALPRDWHSGEPGISRFFDALSLTFPEGERFFIDSVKHYAGRIADPALKEEVKRFTAQEAIHSREHIAYNRQINHHGIDTAPIERAQAWALEKLARRLPHKTQLAATCALEHYTATFAEIILSDPRVMDGAHPLYADLWRWHAMEEEEHKAVAFDVFKTVAPGWRGYLRRILVMTFITLDFSLAVLVGTIYLMAKSGELTNLRAWGRMLTYLWARPGLWRRVLAGVGAYYRPGFHPWQRPSAAAAGKWTDRYESTGTRNAAQVESIFRPAEKT